MNAAGRNREPVPGPTGTEPHRGDMAPLIRRVRELLAMHEGSVTWRQVPMDAESLRRRFGFAGRRQGRAEIILSEDVAVELGHPSTASRAVVLSTFDPEIVHHDRISIAGPDLGEMASDRRYPLGQAVILSLRPDSIPDPFDMENTQYLMNRLPGFMVRSVPGKLWVRIGRKARAAGMTLETVGSALAAAYTESFPDVEKVEVVFITSPSSAVEELARIAAEADILAGRHKKLALGVDGDVECRELNCEGCDEKPVCDNLRDIVVKRRAVRPR
jgi:CO dehydrogenase/acetyl-CoA synthase beta subunit